MANNERTNSNSGTTSSRAPVAVADSLGLLADEKRLRLMTYVCQRKKLFSTTDQYVDVLYLLNTRNHDVDEQLFLELMRQYIECCQRLVRSPQSQYVKSQCSVAFDNLTFELSSMEAAVVSGKKKQKNRRGGKKRNCETDKCDGLGV